MGDERRSSERHPSFTVMDVVARGKSGHERDFSIMTRDTSSSGIGGVYVGQEPVNPEDEFFLKEAANRLRPLRLAWGKRAADYVFILGFEFLKA
jgi:hypothetical protein